MEKAQNHGTNKMAIRRELENGNRLTVAQVFTKLRTLELRHYIAELRKEGMAITDRWVENNGKRFKQYWKAENA